MSLNWVVVLCSGAEHLKGFFEERRVETLLIGKNYDGKRFFPNTDIYTRIQGVQRVSGKNVAVIQCGTFSMDESGEGYTSSDRFFETLQVLSTLKTPLKVRRKKEGDFLREEMKGASRILTIFTFLPFSKQDNAYETGEANSAKLVIDHCLIYSESVAAIDPHPPDEFSWVSNYLSEKKFVRVSVIPKLIERAKEIFDLDEFEIVTPPGKYRGFKVTEGVSKTRETSFKVRIVGEYPVKGKKVILVDDMTLTGGTLIRTNKLLRDSGAEEVICCTPHLVPMKGKNEKTIDKLMSKLKNRLVISNTVRNNYFKDKWPENMVDCSSSIIELLKRLSV